MHTQAFLGFNAPMQNLVFSNKVVVPEKGVWVVWSTLPRHGTSNRRIRTREPEQPPLVLAGIHNQIFICTRFQNVDERDCHETFHYNNYSLDIHGVPYGMYVLQHGISIFQPTPRTAKQQPNHLLTPAPGY